MQRIRLIKLVSIIAGLGLFAAIIQGYAVSASTQTRPCVKKAIGVNNTVKLASMSHGAQEWSNNCARCHNARGPSEFSSQQWQTIMLHMRLQGGLTGQEARDIYSFLAAQSGGTETQLAANAPKTANTAVAITANTTIAAAKPTSPTATSPTPTSASPAVSGQSGSMVYHQTCIACHGANGKGAVPGAPDFTSSSGPLSKSDSILMQHIINGYQAPGSTMAMPARGGNPKLTDQDLKNTLAYIRSTFGH